MPVEWLDQLERDLASDPDVLATAVVTLAALAGSEIDLDDDELHGAARRSLLLLAAGGDPARGLDLNGRAVESLAAELDTPGRRATLADGLARLRQEASGRPHVSEAVKALADAPDVAWRAYACSLLAERLGEDEE